MEYGLKYIQLKLIVIKGTHQKMIMDPSPVRNLHVLIHKFQQSVIIFQDGSWDLQTWKEHIKNIIKNPSLSQEPLHTPKLQQQVINLWKDSLHLHTWQIFMKF